MRNLLTCSPAHLLTCPPAHLPTCSPAHLLTCQTMTRQPASRKRSENSLPYLLILPTIFFVALFTAWPTILSIYQSFFRQRLNIAKFRDPSFVGLENYVKLFTDEKFHQVALNTFYYAIGTVP
ncbi:MAG TPA: sugar ABC transporter permease, partial [Chloroflexi bacterium]|nr:sugar ABC transporter permease [Chloroflexota bacterium]